MGRRERLGAATVQSEAVAAHPKGGRHMEGHPLASSATSARALSRPRGIWSWPVASAACCRCRTRSCRPPRAATPATCASSQSRLVLNLFLIYIRFFYACMSLIFSLHACMNYNIMHVITHMMNYIYQPGHRGSPGRGRRGYTGAEQA